MNSVARRAQWIWGALAGESLFCALLVGIAITIYCGSVIAVSKAGEVEVQYLSARSRIYWTELWATEGRRDPAESIPPDVSADRGKYSTALPVDVADGSVNFQLTSARARS